MAVRAEEPDFAMLEAVPLAELQQRAAAVTPLAPEALDALAEGEIAERVSVVSAYALRAVEKNVVHTRELLAQFAAEAERAPLVSRTYYLIATCRSLQFTRSLGEAASWCNDAIALAAEAGDSRAWARALTFRATLHYEAGQVDRAIALGKQALRQARLSGDEQETARVLNNLGVAERTGGLYERALERFSEALTLIDAERAAELWHVLQFNVGLCHQDFERFDLALDHFQETRAWANAEGFLRMELTAANYIGELYLRTGQPGTAVQLMQEYIQRRDLAALHNRYRGRAYNILGQGLMVAGALDEAEQVYRDALTLTGDEESQERFLLEIGHATVLSRMQRLPEAGQLLDAVIARLHKLGMADLLVDAYSALAVHRERAGDLQGALSAERQMHTFRDGQRTRQLENRLAVLRAGFELDRQTLDLAELQRDRALALSAIGVLVAFIVIGYLWFSRAQQRQSAELAQQSNAELERLVDERTAELELELKRRREIDAQRLELTKRIAEDDKMRILGQLTGGVAHDFNNLLMVVMGSAELLKFSEHISAGDRELVSNILRAAGDGADITRALMSYARQQPLRLEVVEINQYLAERIPLLRHTLGGGVEVATHVHLPSTVNVRLDRGQLTTALLNLLLNARDAQQGKGVIQLEASLRSEAVFALTISDSGIGMTEDVLQRAVEPFFTTRREGGGTGLGLSMVFGFAKQLGGDLEIHSKPGVGTTVTILLPVQFVRSQQADVQVAGAAEAVQ